MGEAGKTMRKSIIYRRRDVGEESNRVVRLGKEKFKLGLQTFKNIHLSHLLLMTVFGKDHSNIVGKEK